MSPDATSPQDHGFVRVAGAVPVTVVADPAANTGRTLELLGRADESGAAVVVFPELGLCAYSSDDLLQQDALLDGVLDGLRAVVEATRGRRPVITVGAPLVVDGGLFNCAVVCHDGEILGAVPKSYLPNYREFYEQRWFAAARDAGRSEIRLLGADVPFGTDLVFEARDVTGLSIHVEICEDAWVAIPPSTWAALGGATVLANLSGSPVTVGKAGYRRALCEAQSARCIAAYIYTGAGWGESTTDVAWDGDALITENGNLLARSEQFAIDDQLVVADVDLDRLRQERMRMISLRDQAGDFAERIRSLRRVPFDLAPMPADPVLQRYVARFPFVPAGAHDRDERCREVIEIQVQGLAKRLRASGIGKVVIGVSGGLDSTLALLVAAETMDRLGLPRSDVLAYTMPGFATGDATLRRAHELMRSLGVTAQEIDIRPSCLQMLADLDHPFATGEKVYDVTFENVQAGERTSHLFRLANRHGALVLGTGDLSELALGWCTYGVGDQMSHYNVNASVPKTLIQHLIRWMISTGQYSPQTGAVLAEIIDDVITPELVPADEASGAVQSTEDSIGPYELHDFFLYYLTRFGYRPSKIAYLAHQAWGDRERGEWSDMIAPDRRNAYDVDTINAWLRVFLTRFMSSQFKRTAMPNAPKIGSGGSLSPRGDWRSPSDASVAAWLADLDAD
ncbi:NAD(+) synthase [Williamsia sterculiae]|uniref:Glutamine-dependent NAD(+) synthetase n=1 Tax=Williamsia sterculiae TaxID=1344003 RepID=A0A1N7GWM4_9NOCA|nr:NAD(+) synthase [Williamsia sterculiae]SIS16995.1 NAD+ synthase (glutamine-hydrolysing) [Williamsia sterculiae]